MTKRKYASNDFPVERVRELFDYNPKTGYLISRTSKRKAGKPIIGTPINRKKSGWTITMLREDGSMLRTNYGRVVFAWHYGRWPDGEIDHLNRDPRDNRISNLREADRFTQTQNRSCFNYGAYWNKAARKWVAQIRIKDKKEFLGCYNTVKEAQEAYFRTCDEIGHPYLEPTLVDGICYIATERVKKAFNNNLPSI